MNEPDFPVDIQEGEYHPAADNALEYIKVIPPPMLAAYERTLEAEAKNGNRLAQICYGTLKRLLNSEPVSDRYLLGLAWTLRDLVGMQHQESMKQAQTEKIPGANKLLELPDA